MAKKVIVEFKDLQGWFDTKKHNGRNRDHKEVVIPGGTLSSETLFLNGCHGITFWIHLNYEHPYDNVIPFDAISNSEKYKVNVINGYAYVYTDENSHFQFTVQTSLTGLHVGFGPGEWLYEPWIEEEFRTVEELAEKLKGFADFLQVLLSEIIQESHGEYLLYLYPPGSTSGGGGGDTRFHPKDLPINTEPSKLPKKEKENSHDEKEGSVKKEEPAKQKATKGLDRVGGYESTKIVMRNLIQDIKNPDSCSKFGTKPPCGVLLYGPPGTGKTLFARALSEEINANFIHVKYADIATCWYGEEVKAMQKIFDEAKKDSPSVIFFDEIDNLASARNDRTHHAHVKLLNTILQNLDGLDHRGEVFVVAATNRPEAIDKAILRPGRIDHKIEIPLPDPTAILAIYKVHKMMAENKATIRIFNKKIDWKTIIKASDGLSGADVAEVVRRATYSAMVHYRKTGKVRTIGTKSFLEVIKDVRTENNVNRTEKHVGFRID